MDEENKVKLKTKIEVRDTRGTGGSRMRWMDNIRHDMNKRGLEEGDVSEGKDGEGWCIEPDLAYLDERKEVD